MPEPVTVPDPAWSRSVERRLAIQMGKDEPPPGSPHIVLVTGGRDWVDRADRLRLVHVALAAVSPRPDIIVVGGDDRDYPNGVDAAAYRWALESGIQPAVCPANWTYWKRAAGPIRNGAMLLLRPHLVLAFPGGKGTQDMVLRATAAGVPVRRVQCEEST